MSTPIFILTLWIIFIVIKNVGPFVAEWVREHQPEILDYSIGRLLFEKKFRNREFIIPDTTVPQKGDYWKYEGKDLNFDDVTLVQVLEKYFPYYRTLLPIDQTTFTQRLQKFIQTKTFHLNTLEPYREMPILVSASAIQLSLGLKHFMLPWFSHICIYPEAYVGINPLRVLAGNVQGKTINISWKHFLEETLTHDNGENVGLHEMAHALHTQMTYHLDKVGSGFRKAFHYFDTIDDNIRDQEKLATDRLYSDYALQNVDEFWAKSVELFFEKPGTLYFTYPMVYDTLTHLLNQNPYVYPKMGSYHRK